MLIISCNSEILYQSKESVQLPSYHPKGLLWQYCLYWVAWFIGGWIAFYFTILWYWDAKMAPGWGQIYGMGRGVGMVAIRLMMFLLGITFFCPLLIFTLLNSSKYRKILTHLPNENIQDNLKQIYSKIYYRPRKIALILLYGLLGQLVITIILCIAEWFNREHWKSIYRIRKDLKISSLFQAITDKNQFLQKYWQLQEKCAQFQQDGLSFLKKINEQCDSQDAAVAKKFMLEIKSLCEEKIKLKEEILKLNTEMKYHKKESNPNEWEMMPHYLYECKQVLYQQTCNDSKCWFRFLEEIKSLIWKMRFVVECILSPRLPKLFLLPTKTFNLKFRAKWVEDLYYQKIYDLQSQYHVLALFLMILWFIMFSILFLLMEIKAHGALSLILRDIESLKVTSVQPNEESKISSAAENKKSKI